MAALGSVYECIKVDVPDIFSGDASVQCSLASPSGSSQGEGAMLSPSDPSYDASDELRGIPSFIGVSYDPETGLTVAADSAELSIAQSSVTIGMPQKGWTGSVYNIDETRLNFSVSQVAVDRTLGILLLSLKALKAAGRGRKIDRTGDGAV